MDTNKDEDSSFDADLQVYVEEAERFANDQPFKPLITLSTYGAEARPLPDSVMNEACAGACHILSIGSEACAGTYDIPDSVESEACAKTFHVD